MPCSPTKQIDVVYIASPNRTHAADCLLCIAAGKAVLCEKPFAVTEAEARGVFEAARRHNVFCMEAMWTRFFPAVLELKRLIASGELGRIGLIHGNFGFVADPSGSRFLPPEQGGGALLDVGVYLVSLAHFLLGEPSEANGQAIFAASGADATSTFQLAWPDGALATFSASLRINGPNEMLILGDRGRVRLPDPFYRPRQLEITLDPASSLAPPMAAPQPHFTRPRPVSVRPLRRQVSSLLAHLQQRRTRNFRFSGNGYQFQLSEVVRCLNQGRKESPLMPFEDTVTVMRTMDRIIQHWNQTGRP